jgi:hypothetical protein
MMATSRNDGVSDDLVVATAIKTALEAAGPLVEVTDHILPKGS